MKIFSSILQSIYNPWFNLSFNSSSSFSLIHCSIRYSIHPSILYLSFNLQVTECLNCDADLSQPSSTDENETINNAVPTRIAKPVNSNNKHKCKSCNTINPPQFDQCLNCDTELLTSQSDSENHAILHHTAKPLHRVVGSYLRHAHFL